MKKYCLLIFAALLLASSCVKEQEGEVPVVIEEKAPVFVASLEQTKTVIDINEETKKGVVSFVNGDKISVNGTVYVASISGSSVYFQPEDQNATVTKINGKYTAYYPHTLWNSTTSKTALPDTYDFLSGKFNMPAYAEATATESSDPIELKFYHLCGFIGLKVTSSDFSNVSSVTISADQKMSGTFTVNENKAAVLASEGVSSKFVTINIAESDKAISSETGKTFYVPIPVANYSKLMFSVTGTSNNESKTLYMMTKDDKPGDIARNNLYRLTFINNFTGREVAVAITETDEENGRY